MPVEPLAYAEASEANEPPLPSSAVAVFRDPLLPELQRDGVGRRATAPVSPPRRRTRWQLDKKASIFALVRYEI